MVPLAECYHDQGLLSKKKGGDSLNNKNLKDSCPLGLDVSKPGDYQLALVTPGRRPIDAISLNVRRDSLNFLRKPRGRPVNWQRLRRRIGEESRGILFNAMRASSLSSSERFMLRIFFFSSCLLSHLSFTKRSRRFCFSTDDFFAIGFLILFFASGALLTLLAIRVLFIDYIKTAAASNEDISLRTVSLD